MCSVSASAPFVFFPRLRCRPSDVDIINPPAWRAAREGKTTDGPIGTGLHKIGLPDAYYRMENGKMYNGLLTVAYQLQDVDPEQGGL